MCGGGLCAVDAGDDVSIDEDTERLEEYVEPFEPPVELPATNYWGEQVEDTIWGGDTVGLNNEMTLRHFNELRYAFSFRNLEANGENTDQAARIRPLLNLLKTTGSKYVEVGRDVALDEVSVACRSKFGKPLIVYNPIKPTGKYHFRIYMLYCATSWISLNFRLRCVSSITDRLRGVTTPAEAQVLSEESTSIRKYVRESTTLSSSFDKVVDFLIRSQGDGRRVGLAKAGGRGGGAGNAQQQGQHGNVNGKKHGARPHGGSQKGGGQQGGSQQQQQQQRSNSQQRQCHQHDNGNANTAEKPITCWKCGQTGHRQAQCPHPKKCTGEASARQAQQQSGLAESDSDEEDASKLWMASGATNGLDGVSSTWLVDSGASHHMCSDATILSGTSPSKLVVKVANGGLLHASVKGSCILRVQNGSVVRPVLLHEVHHVPGLDRNLLSVTELSEHGVITVFGKAECSLKNPRGDVIAATEKQGKLWVLTGETMDAGTDGAAMFVQVPKATLQQWHDRLGHLNFQALLRMYSKGLTEDMEVVSKKLRFCLSCAEAKQTKSKQPTADTSDSAPTDEVGAVLGVDLKTDIRPADRNGNKHMLTIVDYGPSYSRVYLLQTKDEASERHMEFLPEFERQHGVQMKVVRSDGGGEFFGHEFAAYFKRHGIKQQSSLPDSSASNGNAERMHRTLMNSGRAMLWASGLPERYWDDAVKFGSTCAVHVAHKKAASVKRRAEKAVVIGISEMQKGYRLFLPRTKRIVTSADTANDTPEPQVNEDRTKRCVRVVAPKKRLWQASSPAPSGSSTDSSRSGEDEYAGLPISAGTLRRVFGSRKKPRLRSEFQLAQELVDEVAGSATLVLSEAMTAMVTPRNMDEAQQTPEWP
ncbi:unnamed protein product [Phytophthora fragariaefolia]|uniref:Unnamed protein product n=1 Tax=Phytophthora fragariaefolia TaxID=1490495 RepID=A0A9W6XE71_9STRA|nr:unnamed protein product [Phytophthora fragariaefolia]